MRVRKFKVPHKHVINSLIYFGVGFFVNLFANGINFYLYLHTSTYQYI